MEASEITKEATGDQEMMIDTFLYKGLRISARKGTPESRKQTEVVIAKNKTTEILDDESLDKDSRLERVVDIASKAITHTHNDRAAAVAIAYFADQSALNEIKPMHKVFQTPGLTDEQRQRVRSRGIELAKQIAERAALPKDFLESNAVIVPVR